MCIKPKRASVKAGLSTGEKRKQRYFTELRYEHKARGTSESSSYDLLLRLKIFRCTRERAVDEDTHNALQAE